MKIALISDIHEDVISLEKALKAIDGEKCNEIFCLGDILGFSELYYHHAATRNASECINIVRQNCSVVIAGNHDLHAMKKTPTGTKGFLFPDNWYELDMNKREKLAENKVWLYNDGELDPMLSEKELIWMNNLPEWKKMKLDKVSVFLSHYVYPNLSGVLKGFCVDDNDFNCHKDFLSRNEFDFSIAGHSHYPGLFISSRRIKTKRFNRNYKIKSGDCIIIPPIVNNRNGSGFCIFDSNKFTITAKRF